MDNKEKIINEIITSAGKLTSDYDRIKYVFDWFIKNVNYNYDFLEDYKLIKKEKSLMIDYKPDNSCVVKKINGRPFSFVIEAYHGNHPDIDLNTLSQEEKKLLEEYIEIKNKRLELKDKLKCDIYNIKLGVCSDFAPAYEEICKRTNIPCDRVFGIIDSGGVACGHTWNIVKIGDQIKHIDISSAIHNRDENKNPDEYFLLSTNELLEKDKAKNRTINNESQKIMNDFENASPTR